MHPFTQLLVLCLITACKGKENQGSYAGNSHPVYDSIAAIPLPEGYERVEAPKDSFGEWLRLITLKKENLVYLYNGALKENQSVQYAVMNIPVGKKDLQQCADAVMRLRAEYLFSKGRFSEIEFRDNNNKSYKWSGGNNRQGFERYMEQVFGWCGTASLAKQLRSVDMEDIQQGDVFIKGGFPGHAMIVMDVAMNKQGKKIYMLAQSYMPAQDIHIVKNAMKEEDTCWYEADESYEIITPEWVFYANQLKRW